MLELASPRDQHKVLDALEGSVEGSATGSATDGFEARPVLFIGDKDGENYGLRMNEGNWGQSNIAIGCEATIGGRLPRRLEGAKARLYAQVEDVLVPQMMARRSRFTIDTGLASSLFSAETGGALLSEVKLRRFTEYAGLAPHAIARDAFYRVAEVGGYDKSLIFVDALDAPILSFVGEEGLGPQETAYDVLSRVLEQIPYVARDTAEFGNKTRITPGLGRVEDVSRTFNAAQMPNWIPPQRSDEQYSEVEVYREDERGGDAYRQRAPVVYYGVPTPPVANTPLQIPLNDATADGPKNAQAMANDRARALGGGLYGGQELVLPYFYPLVECLDVFLVYEAWRDDDGLWDRAWLLQVDAYRHKRTNPAAGPSSGGPSPGGSGGRSSGEQPGLSTAIAHTSTLYHEDFVSVPDLIVPLSAYSGGVLYTPGPTVGANANGFFFESLTAVDGEGNPWIGLDVYGYGGWVDPARSGGLATVSASGFFFEID